MSRTNQIPARDGIYEWFDIDGEPKWVCVFNVEPNPKSPPLLRVYFWGGYYRIQDEQEGNRVAKAEWANRWGARIGDTESVPNEELFLRPGLEEMQKIIKSI